jgi:hypothetical protein
MCVCVCVCVCVRVRVCVCVTYSMSSASPPSSPRVIQVPTMSKFAKVLQWCFRTIS